MDNPAPNGPARATEGPESGLPRPETVHLHVIRHSKRTGPGGNGHSGGVGTSLGRLGPCLVRFGPWGPVKGPLIEACWELAAHTLCV